MVHLRHEPLETITFADDRERWAEMEARQFEKNAEYLLEECIPGWLQAGERNSWHPDTAKAIYEIAIKIQSYEDMARQLRLSRYAREERNSLP